MSEINDVDEKSHANSPVPGRLSLEELHKEQDELRAAKKATSGVNPNVKLFNAMSMFSVAVDFGLIIAIPLVGAVYLGRWLDSRYGTKHYILVCLFAALFISSVGIYKQIIKLSKQIKKK